MVAMNMPAAITVMHPNTVRRRPILSATPPRKIEPNAMPNTSMERTMPSAPRSMPHSFAIPGDA